MTPFVSIMYKSMTLYVALDQLNNRIYGRMAISQLISFRHSHFSSEEILTFLLNESKKM